MFYLMYVPCVIWSMCVDETSLIDTDHLNIFESTTNLFTYPSITCYTLNELQIVMHPFYYTPITLVACYCVSLPDLFIPDLGLGSPVKSGK